MDTSATIAILLSRVFKLQYILLAAHVINAKSVLTGFLLKFCYYNLRIMQDVKYYSETIIGFFFLNNLHF